MIKSRDRYVVIGMCVLFVNICVYICTYICVRTKIVCSCILIEISMTKYILSLFLSKQILSSRDNNLFIVIFYSLKYLYPGIS